MAKNTAINLDVTRNVDGFTIAGGSTDVASLRINATTNGDAVELVSGFTGSSSLTLPNAASGTLALTSQIPAAFAWNGVSGTSQAMAVNSGYVSQNGATSTFTLPATAAQYTVLRVLQNAAGVFIVAQNALQNIRIGNSISTTGVGGSVTSTSIGDALYLLCTVANTNFVVLSSVGSFTVV